MLRRWDPFLTFSMLVIGAALIYIGPEGKLDARFFYSSSEASAYFKQLSADERMIYFWGEFLDYLFMINYTLVLIGLANEAYHQASNLKKLAYIPAAVDLLETFTIQMVLGGILPDHFALLPILTTLKWLVAFFILGIIGPDFLKKKFFTRS